MDSEENNFETVVIEGQVWAVTPGNEDSDMVLAAESLGTETTSEQSSPEESSEATESIEVDNDESTPSVSQQNSADTAENSDSEGVGAGDIANDPDEPEFDSLRSLTSLLIGGAIEGTSQLVTRLREYEEELRARDAEEDDAESAVTQEDELDRLRYAFVGMVLDVQSTFRRNVSLWARALDGSARATDRVTRTLTPNFLFRPLQRRYNGLVRRGEDSLARWVADGRTAEPQSRELAKMTYKQIVDEFIDTLAENPELQDLITQQSIGLASEARDEVRERTVTADNIMESIVRRILRRTPRAELPPPPPEVQRWSTITLDEYKVETKPEDADS